MALLHAMICVISRGPVFRSSCTYASVVDGLFLPVSIGVVCFQAFGQFVDFFRSRLKSAQHLCVGACQLRFEILYLSVVHGGYRLFAQVLHGALKGQACLCWLVLLQGDFAQIVKKFDMHNDQQVAEVVNFIRSSWGNSAKPVSASDVASVRKDQKDMGSAAVPEHPDANK